MTTDEARLLASILSQSDEIETWCTCWCCMDGLAKRLSTTFPPHRFHAEQASEEGAGFGIIVFEDEDAKTP